MQTAELEREGVRSFCDSYHQLVGCLQSKQKVQAAEDAWNTRDPEPVSLAYSEDSIWRNRDKFLKGRAEIVAFPTAKWKRELDYALRTNLWCFEETRFAVRFQHECRNRDGQW